MGTSKILLGPPGRCQAYAALGLPKAPRVMRMDPKATDPSLRHQVSLAHLLQLASEWRRRSPKKKEPQMGPSRARFDRRGVPRFRPNGVLVIDCPILAFSRCILPRIPVTRNTLLLEELSQKTLGPERPWGRAVLSGQGVPKSRRGVVAAPSEVAGLGLAGAPRQRRRARSEAARRQVSLRPRLRRLTAATFPRARGAKYKRPWWGTWPGLTERDEWTAH